MIQLAMPTQPGNSGGPLVDPKRSVRGIIDMKSAVDDNLGFAIPSESFAAVRSRPNPVAYDRWVTLGTIDSSSWTTLFAATWQRRGGHQRSWTRQGFWWPAPLSNQEPPPLPIEVAVMCDSVTNPAPPVWFSTPTARIGGTAFIRATAVCDELFQGALGVLVASAGGSGIGTLFAGSLESTTRSDRGEWAPLLRQRTPRDRISGW